MAEKYIRENDVYNLFPQCGIAKLHVAQIDELPRADVVEVIYGEWLPDYETFIDEWERESEPFQTGWVCSLCGRQEFAKEPYCHCGAKMDRKDGEGK